MRQYLWQLRPYFRQVSGELVLGSIAGIVMNTAIVLPAIPLGRAIDAALALERGQASPRDVGLAALIELEAAGWDWQAGSPMSSPGG